MVLQWCKSYRKSAPDQPNQRIIVLRFSKVRVAMDSIAEVMALVSCRMVATAAPIMPHGSRGGFASLLGKRFPARCSAPLGARASQC